MKRKKLWERSWARALGVVALSGSLVFTEVSVAYGAIGNVQVKNTQIRESEKKAELSVEEYLLKCFEQRQERIDMTAYDLTWNELGLILDKMEYEYPELYWLQDKQNYEKDENGKVTVYIQYYGDGLDRREELENEWQLVKEKTENCKTDLEKALVVHDYLCDTITYVDDNEPERQDIEGAILEKEAVCEGYALAYKYYMNRLGIPCKVIRGFGREELHAWNEIMIDGKWYLVDTTWDDAGEGQSIEHDYFLCSEEAFDGHTWNKDNYERCTDTTYDDAFWNACQKEIIGYQGGLYYCALEIGASNELKVGIFRYDVKNPGQSNELVIPIEDSWKDAPDSNTVSRGVSELVYYKGMLYYNTTKAVWKWNFKKEEKPEKVFDLASSVQGDIWDIEIANGKLYYETAVGEHGERERHEFLLDSGFQKLEQPIAVSEPSFIVPLGLEKGVFLRAAAPGKLTYSSKDSSICEATVVWKDESCELIPKKTGKTEVVIKAEETDRYLAGETTVMVEVVKSDTELEISLNNKNIEVENNKVNLSGHVWLSVPERNKYKPTGTVTLKVLSAKGEELLKKDYAADTSKAIAFDFDVESGHGSYQLVAQYSGDSIFNANEESITCSVKNDCVISASLPKTITYGDSAKADIKIVDASTGQEVDPAGKNLKVTSSENIIYKDGNVTAVDSGEYNLKITADGMQEVVLKGTVAKRKATVKAKSISRDKKDKHIEPTVVVENRADLDKDKEFGILVDCDVNQNTPIGEYPISVSGGNDYFLSRYEPTYVGGTYKITGVEDIVLHYEAGENGSLKAVKAGTDIALSDGQEIEPNTEVKFTATPKEGYVVKNWIVNGNVYKEDGEIYTGKTLSRVITSSNDSVKVEFVKEKKYYQVSAKAVLEDNSLAEDVKITVKDEAGNVVTSASDILEGTKITAEADCPKDMDIVKWVINGKDYPSENTISFVLESDTEVKLVVKQKEEEHTHVYDVEKVEDRYKASDATCTEPAKYYKSCACGERSDVTFSFGEALGHAYGEAVWNWSSDNKTAEAVFTCGRDKTHVEKVTAEVTSKVTKNPTCTEQGETAYTATVTFGGKVSTDTKTVKNIQALGHKFEYGMCSVCGATDPNYKKYELADSTWTKGDEKDVVVEISAEIGKIAKVTIDGKDLEKDSYVVAEGTLTIKSDMLEKLMEGQHSVQIRGEKGYAELTVTIEKEEVVEPPKPDPEKPTEPSNPDPEKPTEPSNPDSGKPTNPTKPNNQGSDTQQKPTKPDNKNQNTDAKSAKTGDNSSTLPLLTLAGGAMLIGISAYKKREKETEE